MGATPPGRGSRESVPRGRARDPELDGAIIAATRELLEERGPAELTMEAIAQRAGVARATVYRRWPNRDALLVHLLRGLVREFAVPDHGNVRDDLIALLDDQLGVLERDAGKLYPSLGVQACVDPAAADALRDLVQRRRAPLEEVLRRGIEREELCQDLDLELASFLLWGPVYYRYVGALSDNTPIERDFITKLVDSILLGIGAVERSS